MTNLRIYEYQTCSKCLLKAEYTKAKGNRMILISFSLREYRSQAKANLTTEAGQQLRAKRPTKVETVFAIVKQNMDFRRFHLRGQDKVKTE